MAYDIIHFTKFEEAFLIHLRHQFSDEVIDMVKNDYVDGFPYAKAVIHDKQGVYECYAHLNNGATFRASSHMGCLISVGRLKITKTANVFTMIYNYNSSQSDVCLFYKFLPFMRKELNENQAKVMDSILENSLYGFDEANCPDPAGAYVNMSYHYHDKQFRINVTTLTGAIT